MEKSTTDDVRTSIREKHAAKQAAKRAQYEEHKEAVATGTKKLEVNQTPEGLYWVRFEGGGPLPEELKCKFTSLYKLQQIVEKRYGKDMLK